MEPRRRMRAVTGVWLSVIMLLAIGTAAGQEVELPDEVFFYGPVASPPGQTSVWVNPAAIGMQLSGSMVIFTHREERVFRDWGSSVTARNFGAAYRYIEGGNGPDHKEYIFAVGGGQRTRFGLSYRYIKSGWGYLNKRHLWTLGFMTQRSRNLAIGGRIENLNRTNIDGIESDIRYVFGAAGRVYRDLVTMTFDVDMTSGENLHAADFRTGFEVRPKPGLYLYLDFDNHSRFNIGFRVNLGSSYAGHYHNFDRDVKSRLGTSYVGSVSGRQPSLTKPKPKTLMLNLSGRLPENPKIFFWKKPPLKFFDYVDGIYRAAEDDEIGGLFLEIEGLSCGMGKVQELADALAYFKAHRKPVVAYLAEADNLGYLLASGADRVIIPPVSGVNLIGLRANLVSYKGLMDKIGVEAEVERVDEYKTAPERFMFDRPSQPAREQIDRLLDTLHAEMVADIAANRSLPEDSVAGLIDRAPLISIEAKECGLVDEMLYRDEARKQYVGGGGPLPGRTLSYAHYLHRPVFDDRWGVPPRLALVIADGDITAGESGGKIGEYEMLRAIRRAGDDHHVKGVAIRVNSPGGDALASDLIRHEIEMTAKKKPVVISMGNQAASGGYYISTVDGPIFVNRATLTGSIGVYAGKASLAGLFEKLGVYYEMHSRGENAGMYSLTIPFTPEQRQKLREHLRALYGHFTELVAGARPLSADSADALGRGQVWTGIEAVENGLADSIGGLRQAMDELARRCGVNRKEAQIVAYPRQYYYYTNPFALPSVWDIITEWLSTREKITGMASLTEAEHIFFRMPYSIEIE